MKAAFGGYEEKLITFGATRGVLAGVPMMMSADGAVAPYAAGKAFCGVAVNVCDGFTTVQLAGYVRLPYTGTTPAVSYQTLVGDGTGKIKTGATGRQFLAVGVDTSAVVCGVIL